MKHTQGKWEVRNGMIFSGSLAIAKVRVNNKDEAQANARLIASAPELLEACKQLLNACKRDDVLVRHISNAEQAISKAYD